jgi:hypothetical protein
MIQRSKEKDILFKDQKKRTDDTKVKRKGRDTKVKGKGPDDTKAKRKGQMIQRPKEKNR